MGNAITDNLKIGTLGELLVQIRLLEHNVQAAPPIKDSGNDLIAIRGEVFRGIQIKTTAGMRVYRPRLPKHYHIVAVVHLSSTDNAVLLDQSRVFLVPREVVEANSGRLPSEMGPYELTGAHVDTLFGPSADDEATAYRRGPDGEQRLGAVRRPRPKRAPESRRFGETGK
jgi:hypothetical protein